MLSLIEKHLVCPGCELRPSPASFQLAYLCTLFVFQCKWSRKGFVRTRWCVADWYVYCLASATLEPFPWLLCAAQRCGRTSQAAHHPSTRLFLETRCDTVLVPGPEPGVPARAHRRPHHLLPRARASKCRPGRPPQATVSGMGTGPRAGGPPKPTLGPGLPVVWLSLCGATHLLPQYNLQKPPPVPA